ncbi:hypothetical protein BDB00DRAFT_845631 [Zychaea mexicana]|uniref:uncharacterized protein n=1 Tax=Zychaea mexicana TaxID=64656 RepID=UPI0022FE4EC2|nr:uncharacterized protein BDB00DRAFT_845631 [Zychaea mexicana]KAI9488984.1 hypothetical protein BDB00DRAFT_845631 [Zychaea mexicana]
MGDMDEDEYRLSKQTMRRNHAIHELLETERDYVTDLGRLVEVYFDTLARQDWIPLQHKQTILRNASDLLSFHRIFLATLDENFEERGVGEHIAKAFLDMGDHFLMYTRYCDLHDEAWSLCEEYRDRPEWSHFTKECTAMIAESTPVSSSVVSGSLMDQVSSSQQQLSASSSPVGKRLQFEDYLIKPVQRICRYQLLLKEIIRYTPDDADDYAVLNDAMNLVHTTVAEIDRLKNEKDIGKRTERFVQRFDGDWRINKRHVVKLGNLLISGAIEVTYTALGQSVAKPRYLGCFVFPTYLILVRPKKVTTYEPKHWFPLRLAELEDLADIEGQQEHSFVVRCKKHTFAFSATCNQEKQLWLKHLEDAIERAKLEESVQKEELIVPSLAGIAATPTPTKKLQQQQQQQQSNVRLSRSFTNILDMRLSSSCNNYSSNSSSSNNSNSHHSNNGPTSPIPIELKRSVSTSVQLNNIIADLTRTTITNSPSNNNNNNVSSNNASSPSSPPKPAPLQKRYSADYPASRRKELLKSRTNSEISRKRPGSLDLLSSTPNATAHSTPGVPMMAATPSTPTNMIGKMSMQIKSNHQNALRVAVDHKLHAVCTQDYLSSRATWYLRDRENNVVDLRKRKSMPFMRSSASSFSIMSPSRRISELPQPHIQQQQQTATLDLEIQSTVSSTTSSAAVTSVTATAAAAAVATTNDSLDTLRPSSRTPSPRRTLPHSASDYYCMSSSSSTSPISDTKINYSHSTALPSSMPTSTTMTNILQQQPRLTIDTQRHREQSKYGKTTTTTTMTPSNAATTPISLFSGMDRSLSTLSMQPFKKNALVDRMFSKLSNLSKKSMRRRGGRQRRRGRYLDDGGTCDDDHLYRDDMMDDDDDEGSHYTEGDYTSDLNSYNASEMDDSRQDSMSNISLCRYRSAATDQGGTHHHRHASPRRSHNKGPIFRWIRSESGVSTSKRSYNRQRQQQEEDFSTTNTSSNHQQNSERPPVAFAYASTPVQQQQQQEQEQCHPQKIWKRTFSASKKKLVSSSSRISNLNSSSNNTRGPSARF